MEHFTLKSPYFHLVVLFLCFQNINVSQTFKSFHEGLPYFFINDAG